MGLGAASDAGVNPANTFQIHLTPRHFHGLRVCLRGLTGAVLFARRHPFENVTFRIPNAAGAFRAEEARTLARHSPAFCGANADAAKICKVLPGKRAAFGGVVEQLTKLFECHLGHDDLPR